jgi:hypothetical protein
MLRSHVKQGEKTDIFILKVVKFKFYISLLLPLTIFGQKEYAPMGAVWNYEGHSLDCEGNHIQYRVEKEIRIQGKDCSVIYCYTSTDLDTVFRITPDSLIVWEHENKVYFLDKDEFYLLYDFNAEVGDTITYYNPVNRGEFSHGYGNDPELGPDEFHLRVVGIEINTIGSQTRKFFATEPVYEFLEFCATQEIIIENIGSTSQGLTGDACDYVADGCFGGLACYRNENIEYNGTRIFPTPHPDCDFLDSNDDLIREEQINIYPNPFLDEINIETKINIDEIDVVDVHGQILKTYTHQSNLELGDLSAGIYFLRIKIKNSVVDYKIVRL